MSTDKPDEALKRLLFEKAFMRHYTNGAHLLERFDTGHYRSEEARAAWQIACIFSASLAAHEAEQQAGEAVAWRWEHYHITTGVVVGSGLSDTKVQPTRHAMPAGPDFDNGWIGTRVQPLYTRPQQPLSDEQIAVLKFLDGSGLLRGAGYGCLPYGERRPFWWRRQLGDAFPQIRAHGITKDTK